MGRYEYRYSNVEGCDSLVVYELQESDKVVEIGPSLIVTEVGGEAIYNVKTKTGKGRLRWQMRNEGEDWKELEVRIEGQGTSQIKIRDVLGTDHKVEFRVILGDNKCPDTSMVVRLELDDPCKGNEPALGRAVGYQRGIGHCSKEDYPSVIPSCWEWKYGVCSRRYRYASPETRVRGVLRFVYDKALSELQTLINRPEYTGTRYMGYVDEYECFICLVQPGQGREEMETRAVGKGVEVAVYPNPFDEEVTIDISGDQTEEIIITLTDVLGRVCHTEMVQTTNYPYTMEVNQELQGGIYFLRIADKSGQVMYQTKLIRQN